MTNTIYDILSSRLRGWQRHDGKFGIEIETETAVRYDLPSLSFWLSEGDGSLRNYGVEYITPAPLNEEQLDEAFREFNSINQPFIEDSISTSVHVHYNILNLEPIVLANALTVYAVLEPILCKYSGIYRESNLFCLQLRDAEAGIDSVSSLIEFIGSVGKTGGSGYTDPDRNKYAALNVGSFYRLGSIEFRSMRGVVDTDVIKEWCSIIDKIFKYAATKSSPRHVMEDFQFKMSDMLEEIFSEHREVLEYDGWEEDADKNLWLALNIEFSIDDWENFGIPVPVKLSRKDFDLRLLKRAERRNQTVDQLTSDDHETIKMLMLINAGANGSVEGTDWTWAEEETSLEFSYMDEVTSLEVENQELPRAFLRTR